MYFSTTSLNLKRSREIFIINQTPSTNSPILQCFKLQILRKTKPFYSTLKDCYIKKCNIYIGAARMTIFFKSISNIKIIFLIHKKYIFLVKYCIELKQSPVPVLF